MVHAIMPREEGRKLLVLLVLSALFTTVGALCRLPSLPPSLACSLHVCVDTNSFLAVFGGLRRLIVMMELSEQAKTIHGFAVTVRVVRFCTVLASTLHCTVLYGTYLCTCFTESFSCLCGTSSIPQL